MLRTFTYHLGTPAVSAVQAILASTRLVFISDGEAIAFPSPSRG